MQSLLLKIIGTLITLLIVGGAIWYMVRPQAPKETGAQPQQNGTAFPSQTSVSTSPGSVPQAQQKEFNFSQMYAQLFQDLLAKKVDFTAVNSASGGAEASVYKLYEADAEKSRSLFSSGEVSFNVAFVDINEDGVSEALVYENLPGYCGSGGCPFEIYQEQQGKWVRLSSLLGGPNVGLSNTYVNGYLDFFLTVSGDTGSQSKIIRYRWDGKEYRAKEVVAFWDGSRFTLAQ